MIARHPSPGLGPLTWRRQAPPRGIPPARAARLGEAVSAARASVGSMTAMPLTANDLACLTGGTLEGEGDRERPLRSIEVDSREVVPHSAFFALRGEREDGHAYVNDAVRRGATCLVVRDSWRRGIGGDHLADTAGGAGTGDQLREVVVVRVDDPNLALRRACSRRLHQLGCAVVAITGSVGKTTTKEMCALALGSLSAARTPRNLNTWTSIPRTVLQLEPPLDVFVAELAMSAPGEIRDLARMTAPGVGVVLNVGLAHVGLLGSIEAIAAAKAELLEELPVDGRAVCNGDDPWVRAMAGRSRAPVTWFGLHAADLDYTATDVELDGLRGTRFRLRGPDGEVGARLRLCGEHAVLDACAAAAVAGCFGVGVAEVAERLAELDPPEHRGTVRRARGGAVLYDDCYNSSPTSLAAALEVLRRSGRRRRVAVVGDMLELGPLAATAHREAGERCAAAATDLVAVGAFAEVVAHAARQAGMEPSRVHGVAEVEAAAELVAQWCDAETAVLVKGSHAIGLERVVEHLTR